MKIMRYKKYTKAQSAAALHLIAQQKQRVAPTRGFPKGAIARWRAAPPCAAQSLRAGPLGAGRQGPRRPLAPGARGRAAPGIQEDVAM